ncbi:hypothetical protein HETIRDRAFT_169210 [Heterobasidion irregulare TC 32-1]|uniref:Uncharacterized protein n=1 Tax=Heterobasidion irregulare (strain TC 32-1) TaxID=747525 RepID=W4K508_HETIT|nr:uncharacterized protein HETIRDRAFT_169210 [Heterobasidion irregulare TC 32-1]ETW80455.1 hypothetical protein HETIRDRAFT_169210 [Heterobasidion irregulare TC 32-1]
MSKVVNKQSIGLPLDSDLVWLVADHTYRSIRNRTNSASSQTGRWGVLAVFHGVILHPQSEGIS